MEDTGKKNSYICKCKRVTYHEVDTAIIEGASNSFEVTLETNAGSGCGGCRPIISKRIDEKNLNKNSKNKSGIVW